MPTTWIKNKTASLLFFFLILAAWELLSRAEVVSALYFPPMSRILAAFWDLTVSLTLPLEVGRSFGRMACGYGAAAALMIPLGVCMGISTRVHALFEPTIEFLRPLPPPAIIPAVMLFLGIDSTMKIFVIFFACAFPIVLNTIDGVRSVPPLLLQTGRSFGLGPAALIRKIVLPAALPRIMSGLRISLPISLIVAVLSEMIGSVDGIGHFILHQQRTFNIVEMYAGIVMLGLVGFLLNAAFLRVDKSLLAWYDGWKQGSA